ncbi:MAG TPA: glycosyltransferase family 4 protein [Chloroflexota bacterium]|nr:glycosyltransferase family 4 protein [Chloroflexota bacterium]
MLLNLLPELERQGCPVELLCLDGPNTELGEAAGRLGIATVSVDCAQRVTPRGWLDLSRTIATHRPRMVHVHGYKATILAGAASLARRVPTVATYHGVAAKAGETSRSLSWYLALETPILRRFRRVAAVSEQIANELMERRVARDRIRVIFNGIATPATGATGRLRSDRAKPFSPCILSISRLAPEKNIHLTIDAVAALHTEFPDIGLIVAGDGSLLDELRVRASSLGLQDSIRFLGFVQDVRPLYESCDAFVLASQTEGMPIAVLEAMALGLPIVASRVGGIPLMLDDESDAILVEPNDYRSLYDGLRRLVADEGLRTNLAQAARKRFERDYTAEQMAQSYIRLYDEVAPRS